MWPAALVTGALCGLGIFLAIREFVPATPRLSAVLDRLAGRDVPVVAAVRADRTTRLGAWVERHAPGLLRRGPTPADLDVIGRDRWEHAGQKALCALLGLFCIPLLTLGATLLGFRAAFAVPAAAGLALAAGCWFLPDLDATARAKRARATFARAVAVYLELLAIERISGAGATQATFAAAGVAESWPFRRIAEALEQGRWRGETPWVSLRQLAADVAVPELEDVADIMEQAGREGSAVHEQLQSRAAVMRDAQLDVEQQLAHDATVRMTIPGTLTVFVYFLMLLFPIAVTMFATVADR